MPGLINIDLPWRPVFAATGGFDRTERHSVEGPLPPRTRCSRAVPPVPPVRLTDPEFTHAGAVKQACSNSIGLQARADGSGIARADS